MNRVLVVLFLMLGLLAPMPAQACPACNVQNNLFTSIQSSTDVYVAECDGAGKAKVLRVIAGPRQPGDLVTAEGKAGELLILSNPTSTAVRFPSLQWDAFLEVECRLIARLPHSDALRDRLPETPSSVDIAFKERDLRRRGDSLIKESVSEFVKDADEAVILVQGLSNVTRFCGLAYVRRHATEMDARLIVAITEAMELSSAPTLRWEDAGRIAGLAHALMLNRTPKAQAFAQKMVDDFLAAPVATIELGKEELYYRTAPRASLLLGLIRAVPSGLRSQLKAKLRSGYGKLHGLALAEATQVLCTLKYAPAELRSGLKEQDLDYFALGVMWSATEKTSGWDWDGAVPLYDAAESAATDAALKRLIAKGRSSAKGHAGSMDEYGDWLRRLPLGGLLLVVFPVYLVGFRTSLWSRLLPLPVLVIYAWFTMLTFWDVTTPLIISILYIIVLSGRLTWRARVLKRTFLSLHPYDLALAALNALLLCAYYWRLTHV